jgi:ankyrin repeat protein
MKARTVLKWAIGVIALLAVVALAGVVWLFVAFYLDMEKGEQHRRQFQAELDSGRWDFGDQPALFIVAQGIVKNDPEAIRAAAKNVPDLQAPGRDGSTLLDFAVRRSWQHPEAVDAVETLLSLGADPNYTNGNRNSFAMANAVHTSAPVLRAMLNAGGNANTRDEFGRPIILMDWYLGYYTNQARSRLELLLDHGADVNSVMPKDRSDSAGYPLLLYRTAMGLDDPLAYADALLLLERGADSNRAGADGMTFGNILMAHRANFQQTLKPPPSEFATLWDWAEKHGIVQQIH